MERRLNNILVMAIIGVVCFMSIGYSLLNRELSITGELTYRPNADIRITNLTQGTIKDATIQYADYTKNEINFAYKPTTTSATVALTVEVTNYTDTEMGILKIENLPTNATITGYTLKDKLKNATVPLKAGMSTTFTITFKSTAVETKALTLNFDFEPFYKVTYEGFSSTSGYKMEVLKGDSFSQDIGNNTEICKVTMNGNAISSYTFANGVIGITSVTGDVVINAFVPVVEAETTPNAPVLNGNMIPVYYDNGWKKADVYNTGNSWYDYTNQKWANAVTVISSERSTYTTAGVGTSISMDDINTMWVWIPRYSYTIKSEDSTNYYGKKTTCTAPTQDLPGEIDVKFVSATTKDEGIATYTGNSASGWRTNGAFNFGESSRTGMWVGKFEPTGTLSSTCTSTSCNVSNVTIKPNEASIRNQKLSSLFYMARSMQKNNADIYGFNSSSGDLHIMKNDEWGAVAYLSQSRYGKYGNSDYTGENKEVYINNNESFITGTSGGGPSVSSSEANYEYDDMTNLELGKGQVGPGASTTGNIYGIYDMSGGTSEYVMGVLEYDSQTENRRPGQLVTASSGFRGLNSSGSSTGSIALPNEKYYNTLKSADPMSEVWTDVKPELACDGGVCYGHALSETSSWYQDNSKFVNHSHPWLIRGGDYKGATAAGLFRAGNSSGNLNNTQSCRLVLI